MPNPRVSVIIPAHNRAHLLKTSIGSILAQSFSDLELIVVDDGSTDDSATLVRSYDDPRVRLVTNDRNLGIPCSRNRGLEAARGEYAATLDSDDYAYPERLSRQVAFLDRHPDYAVVGSWASWMDSQGRLRRRVERRPTDADEAAALLIFNSCLAQSSVTARTAILRENPYDELFDMAEDHELWARMAGHHKMASLPEVLVCRRDHDGRTTHAKALRMIDRQHAIYRYQLDLLGVNYNETDVERHHILPRSSRKAGAVNLEYLDWAENWLMRLRGANRSKRHFEQNAFERVLGWGWGAVCYRAAKAHRLQATRRFFRSPLFAPALSGIQRQAMLELSGGPFLARRVAANGLPNAASQDTP